jgi:GNAT superfamily N-acetyltransferase/quercetin dioxygenase-like cupin family protein
MKASIASAEGQLWFLDTLVTIHHSALDEGSGPSVLEHRAPQHDSPPLHVHGGEDELFIVLDGDLRLRVGDAEHSAGPGAVLLAPKLVPHTYCVDSAGGARWMTVTGHGDFERFVRTVGRPAAVAELPVAGGPPSADAVSALSRVAQQFGIQLVGPPLSPKVVTALRPARPSESEGTLGHHSRTPEDMTNAHGIHVVEWQPELMDETVDVLSRAFAKNPIHLAAFGADRVVERNRTFFRVGLPLLRGRRLVALHGSKVVGFVHWVESPGCQYSTGQRVRLVPAMLRGFGLRSTRHVGSWLSAWAKHDERAPHWHFGPIGVDPDVQGQGVGRVLMEHYCSALDHTSVTGYLETDEPNNVAFYRRFGFEVVSEAQIIGTTTFFMVRTAAPAKKAAFNGASEHEAIRVGR